MLDEKKSSDHLGGFWASARHPAWSRSSGRSRPENCGPAVRSGSPQRAGVSAAAGPSRF